MVLQRLQLDEHLHARQQGMTGVLRVMQWSAPEGHDGVAHVLVNGATMLVNHMGHRRQILVHQLRQLRRVQSLRYRGKAAHVREQHRQFPAFPRQRVSARVLGHFAHQFRRHVLAKQTGQQAFATVLNEIAVGHIEQEQCGRR